MRKCDMCGYLVLGDGETCKNCGALLPRVSALVAMGAPPGPPPAAPIAPSPVALPAFSGSPAFEREWDVPNSAPMPAARNHTPRALLVGIVIASMALGWVAMGQFRKSDTIPAGTKDFVAGHGVAYSSPDHTFDAQFPSQPTLFHRQFAVASSLSTLNLAQVETDDYEIVAASIVVPVRVPDSQVDAAIHQILKAGAVVQDPNILSEKKVMIEGAPGIEVRARIKGGYDARLLVIVSGSHFYLLGVHATTGVDRLYDALIASLIIY